MYSPAIIESVLNDFEAKHGWRPVERTLAQVEEFNAYIASIVDIERNERSRFIDFKKGLRLTERRKAEIRRWIENEQFMCFASASYWETRYAFVCNEAGDVYRYSPRKSQQILSAFLEPFDEQQVAIELFLLKARQQGACLSPETRVLTSDLRWLPIDEIKVGDRLVACDEGYVGDPWMERYHQKRKGIEAKRMPERRMRTSIVEARRDVTDVAIKITLEDGRTIVATPDHRLLYKQNGGCQPLWKEVRKTTVGDEIRFVTNPWGKSSFEDGWFGGFVDGEGTLRQKSRAGCELSVSQRFNCAYDRAHDYLRERGYGFREEVDDRKGTLKSKIGNEPVGRLVIGKMQDIFRLVGQCRPSRFIGKEWWLDKQLPMSGWAKVSAIEILPAQRMVDLQTSTKTYIAEGLVSHNSTWTVLRFLHRLLFTPYTQGVQASVNDDTTKLLSRILYTCLERQPFWLPPMQISTKANAPQWANGSIMSIQSGNQKMGIAQGWTPTLIHISEVADIPNPKKVLEEGLFRATHSTRKLFMVLEGTGADSTSWQAEKWRYYKANEGRGGRFCPRFIPWPCCPDLYPASDWLRKSPIPEGWEPMEETKRMTHKAQLFIRSTEYLSRVMGTRWTMPREQQWFWEANYREASATHSTKVWLAQMPITDDEALQSKHDKAFSSETIEVISENRQKEYQAYAITGDSVLIGQSDEPYFPEESTIDYDKERISVTWRNKNGQYTEWELIPLKEFDDKDDREAFNKLLVFEAPRENVDYSIGIDTADGLGNPDEDRACASVALNRQGNQRDIQVAEFVSNNVNPPQMVSIAACIAAWYGGKRGERFSTKDPRGVKFCIEQRMRYGDDCQHQLKLMGFSYHHIFVAYDGKRVDPNAGNKHGWFSNVWSRPLLLTRFMDAVNNGWYKPNSPMLVRQLTQWVRKTAGTGKTKLDHESGKHDDNISAAAQCYFTRHAFDVLTERQQAKYQANDEQNIPISFEELHNTVVI